MAAVGLSCPMIESCNIINILQENSLLRAIDSHKMVNKSMRER